MNSPGRRFVFILGLLMLIFSSIQAQEKGADKIVMTNGDEKSGQITEIGEDYVKFIYSGESLTYTFKKKDINKIQFASGRIEMFTDAVHDSTGASANKSLEAHHNKVAVLPFDYIGRGGSRDDKMSTKVQTDCYNILKKSAVQFTIQDPLTTNALLIKHNINSGNISGLLPAEIAEILGVEYVVSGTVTINQTGTTTDSGTYGSAKTSGKKTTGYTVGQSSTSAEFKTTVDMSIYNDQGTNVFSKSHVSFWQTEDSYTVTLQYLIKRTPLYSK